jgi:hypothetical protein
MDKNILLGFIVIILIIYLYYNMYDQFTSMNENYESIVLSKYAKNLQEKTIYEKIINSTAKSIKFIPKINYGIKLSEYEIYNNTNNLIVSILSKKKEDNNKKELSIFERFYERVTSLNPITVNSKSLIENASSDPGTTGGTTGTTTGGTTGTTTGTTGTTTEGQTQSWTQEADIQTQIFSINILFWAVCFVISIGVIYVIVQNGDRVFKSMGFNKINKVVELTPTETSYIDSLSSPRTTIGGNKIYYTGGYDINLYSE